MSRSFFVGFGAALLILIAWLMFGLKTTRKQWLIGIGCILSSVCFSAAILYFTIVFPFPHTRAAGEYLAGVFGERAIGTDVAVSSRWNLLYPMLHLIEQRPFYGNGFGQTVTFITDDPRIRAMHPDGSWTTTSMEWGWLELWLKMGIMGPLGFICLFGYILLASWSYLKSEKAWVGLWITESIIFLYVTHFFSPYLNHPIGIGLILLAMIMLPNISLKAVVFDHSKKQKTSQAKLATSIAMITEK